MKYKSKNKIDYRMVINSREIAVIRLVCTLFSGVATVAAAISGAGMATCILFGVFAVLGVILVLTVNQRVDYTDKDFTYRDMLRITHRYEYSQVKKIRYGGNLIITVGKRLILIDENQSCSVVISATPEGLFLLILLLWRYLYFRSLLRCLQPQI